MKIGYHGRSLLRNAGLATASTFLVGNVNKMKRQTWGYQHSLHTEAVEANFPTFTDRIAPKSSEYILSTYLAEQSLWNNSVTYTAKLLSENCTPMLLSRALYHLHCRLLIYIRIKHFLFPLSWLFCCCCCCFFFLWCDVIVPITTTATCCCCCVRGLRGSLDRMMYYSYHQKYAAQIPYLCFFTGKQRILNLKGNK